MARMIRSWASAALQSPIRWPFIDEKTGAARESILAGSGFL